MEVRYITHSGDDLLVVNAARVSFDKESEWDIKVSYDDPQYPFGEYIYPLKEKDTKLIKYLAKHGHWTPFGHATITMVLKAPIFVARQLFKHQVGFVVNEVSRRYVDAEPECYYPDKWRARPSANIKQGSSDEKIDLDEFTYRWLMEVSRNTYNNLLTNGICPEQARMVLPQSMYTEWYWTGSLAAWARMYILRTDKSAQKETQEIAEMCGDIIAPLYPVSWEALTDETK